ncbi:MAG: DUF4097 family beta strand repeat protein [Clostridia bacterium]|nr:DUF4097 family beta strand repeat protein [Clostridia bacterium]
MTSFQRRIRDLANLFAIILIVGIFTGVAGLLFVITGGMSIKNHVVEQQQNIEFSEVYEGIEEFEIDLASAELIIASGDELRVETNDSSISIKQKKNKLKIEENGKFLSVFDDTSVILYLPSDAVYEKFNLQSGAGSVSIDKLTSKKMNIEVGAGEATAQYLQAITSADIEVGTGEIYITDGDFNNLKFEVGVGEGYLKGDLTGKNEIEVGIGELVFTANSPISEYTVEAETGIGSFTIGSEIITDNCTIGNGANIIEVNGGIGSIKVDFAQ